MVTTKKKAAKKGSAPKGSAAGEKHDLAKYRAKRDFTKSPEPKAVVKRGKARELFFCVQKHLASRLHYDFRLEHKGVLLSWSVPKGPSFNPKDKRMAVKVEDHPFDYGEFEGVIPSGYGAGIVVLWDKGQWIPEGDVDEMIGKGEIKFRLEGVKLKGSWVLVRTKGAWGVSAGQEGWLLIKHRDEWAGDLDVVSVAPASVKSFGDFADVLRAKGIPPAWKKATPVKSGETALRFREIMEMAQGDGAPLEKQTRAVETRGAAKRSPSGRGSIKAVRSKGRASGAEASSARPKSVAAPLTPKMALAFGKKVPNLTNASKVLWPSTGFTKGQLVDYYTRVAPLMLPHLKGRAVTLKRYPDGVESKFFFEKRCASHRPDWLKTVVVPGEEKGDKTIEYCMIDDISSLAWTANMAAIELHVPLALASAPDVPRVMVFDLDPGPPAGIELCAEVAIKVRGLLKQVGLECWAKHSGGKGIHLYVPLNSKGVTFDQTKAFSKAVATAMEKEDPQRVTASISRAGREGKVYIDWAQNDRDKTTVCVYSTRARERQSVSWPLTWEQIKSGKINATLAEEALKRLKEGDGFEAVLTTVQKLPEAI